MENKYSRNMRQSKLQSKILEEYLTYQYDRTSDNNYTPTSDSKLQSCPSSMSLNYEEKYEKESINDSTSTKYSFQELFDMEMKNEIDEEDFEKEDTPKSAIVNKLDTSKTWENIRSLERIVQMLELSSGVSTTVLSNSKDCSALENVPNRKFMKVIMFILVLSLSFIKLSFVFLEILKKYLEKALVLNWSFIMKNFSAPKEYNESGQIMKNETNFLTFLIVSPLFILFLISYTGLLILYISIKVAMDALPDSIQIKLKWDYWIDRLWNKKFDF